MTVTEAHLIMKRFLSLPLAIVILTVCPAVTEAVPLKVHGIAGVSPWI